MENTPTQPKPKSGDNALIFYILGGVIVTAIIVMAFFFLKPSGQDTASKPSTPEVAGEQTTKVEPTATPAPKGPVGALACTTQYYNTVNGVAESYYLSTEGEVPTAGGAVTCTFTATVNNQVLATDVVTPTVNKYEGRDGNFFRCTTKGLKLKANVPVKVVTELKDATGTTANCNRTFLLP